MEDRMCFNIDTEYVPSSMSPPLPALYDKSLLTPAERVILL